MKRVVLVLILVFVTTVLVAGCGSNGDIYVGKWIRSDPNPTNYFLEIKKNDDSFILTTTENAPALLTMNVVTMQYPAILKKDNNILTVQTGFGSLDISYVKDDNAILFDGKKFKKMTPELEQEYNKKQEQIKAELEKNAPNPKKKNVERGLL
ncbi:MAG: hypothetical protein H6Q69_931 [Firmicutes bacterium]|nr:hypothetical protein [Bacillota bacterium]